MQSSGPPPLARPTAAPLRRLEILGGQEFQNRIRLSREWRGARRRHGRRRRLAGAVRDPCRHPERDRSRLTRGNVARAWLSTLHQAQEWQFAHLSAPPLGTGAGNLTLEDSAEIMATCCTLTKAAPNSRRRVVRRGALRGPAGVRGGAAPAVA